MHDSRMIAEVAPPGCCAMPKVSGSRMATPLAPPRPGSTPMITPRMTPTNISAMFFSDIATPKPPIRELISSMSASRTASCPSSIQPDPSLERALGQRDLEPDFEDQIEHHDSGDRHHDDLPPGVLAQPAHEEADEHHRRDVD